MSRLGLGWLGDPSGRAFAEVAQRAEAAGFSSVWLAETRFTRDAIVASSVVAMCTRRIQVGTAAINVFTRGAALTAITFAALDELANGRVVLGIGPGSPLVLAPQGFPFDHPGTRLREFVAGVRAVWRGASFTGRFVQIDGVRLEFAPPRAEIPIHLAVTGPRALELAGEVGDGVVLNAFTSTDYTKRAVEHLHTGAAKAGRELDGYRVGGAVVVAIDADGIKGRDAVRPLVATYLTGFPNIARESGVVEAELERYRRVRASDSLAATAALIPDEIVDRLTANGTIADCRHRLREYRDAGIDEPVIFCDPRQFDLVIEGLSGA
ncbi:MAG: LLM class flavin-dependent oxidoreductase [Chloroflexi bacterium]|nr:MAG: LLM class flavin-dependent oxidoreductase [Chloroflexota bacterium]TME20623.1 MAG: LLM class flavin-dependent oxidoreductase [Chloroflexota bacterium]